MKYISLLFLFLIKIGLKVTTKKKKKANRQAVRKMPEVSVKCD